jgi:uncharacterized membrane-anchored protein
MSNLKLRHLIMAVFGLIVLAVVNFSILQTETSLAQGRVIFLELAPVDPRSLLQGDYMRLNYAITDQLRAMNELPERGQLVLQLDEQNVATFDRVYQGEALAPKEILVNYRQQGWEVWIGPESFFFQEGHAEAYEDAKYGELRVAENGQVMLTGLRAEDLSPLGPPEE